MRLWSSNEKNVVAPPNVTVVHDVEHVQILRLLVADTYRWKREWATWRIRFQHDDDERGMSFQDVSAFVRDKAAPLCRRSCEPIDIVLYLRDEEDLRQIFRVYGTVMRGVGGISAIQSQASYGEAARVAAMLADLSRPAPRAADPVEDSPVDEIGELPDMSWQVTGHGLSRVATSMVNGHQIRVRLGYVGNSEMWLVDVDHRPDCIHFRARADALSKMGVKMALKAFESLTAERRR